MVNKIQKCAQAFLQLTDIQYRFVIGRKGKSITILLGFDETQFVHLAGLHKLKDNEFLRTASRKKVFKAALEGKIDYSTILKSEEFDAVNDRINYLVYLEDILDSNNIIFKYNSKNNRFSLIQSEYLLQSDYDQRDIYIFIDKQKQSGSHFCRSFFPKDTIDYTIGQTKYTLLYKEKINKTTGESIVQYIRKNGQA